MGAAGPRAKAPLVSWDSGGGSFQLAARGAGGLRVYEGPLGNADVHRELEDKSALPPRVVAVDVASRLPDAPEWLADAITGGTVVAFGHRSSCFRVCADALGKRSYRRPSGNRTPALLRPSRGRRQQSDTLQRDQSEWCNSSPRTIHVAAAAESIRADTIC